MNTAVSRVEDIRTGITLSELYAWGLERGVRLKIEAGPNKVQMVIRRGALPAGSTEAEAVTCSASVKEKEGSLESLVLRAMREFDGQ